MTAQRPTKSDCSGCRYNFYNHNDMGANTRSGVPECWNLKSSMMVNGKLVGINWSPPYDHLPVVKRPNCYKAPGFVFIKQEGAIK